MDPEALNHNQPLNNSFGVNRIHNGIAAGNVNYSTLAAAIDYWKKRYGPRVQGKIDAAAFVDALHNPKSWQPYNTARADTYSAIFLQVYASMGKYMLACGVK